ncbi:hypothetical protein, partial [Pseudomonas syringae group genomosp. 7]|uniref:hypothetical protein n=1 Tax=Pseudomonas syringae group genomosp. 7 TaxID=251699 RepID=UPI00376F6D72
MKKYILSIILSVFAMSIVFSQGTAVLAATTNAQVTTTAKESAVTTNSNSKNNANKEDSNKAVFVQDTLPQTGIEAN